MINAFAVMSVLFALPVLAQAQSPCRSIAGTWQMTEQIDAKGASYPVVGLNLFLYTDTHYSITSLNTAESRQPLSRFQTPGKPTDAEKLRAYEHWAPLTAQAGTYRLNGTDMVTKAIVAKNSNPMISGEVTRKCTMEGDTMVYVFNDGFTEKFTRVAR